MDDWLARLPETIRVNSSIDAGTGHYPVSATCTRCGQTWLRELPEARPGDNLTRWALEHVCR